MTNQKRKGFTLVELMAVIVIIAILLMLVLPAINAVRRAAQRAKARTQCIQIVDAIKKYQIVYGKFPGQVGMTQDKVYKGEDQKIVLDPLMDNPRDKVFIEIPPDAYFGGLFCDPWGMDADRAYMIIIDEDGDGKVEVNLSDYSPAITGSVPDRVAVCSWGTKLEGGDQKERITSWIH